jgi:hypothetical protein
MKTFAVAAVLLTTVFGGIRPAVATTAQERLIVPGRSIGELSLGQGLTSLFTTWGPLYGTEDLSNDKFAGYYWPLRRVGAVASRESNKIVALAISLDDAYLTESGIGAGVTLDAVRRTYGREETVNPGPSGELLIYDALGMAFTVGATGTLHSRVSSVFVFMPGHSREIFPL